MRPIETGSTYVPTGRYATKDALEEHEAQPHLTTDTVAEAVDAHEAESDPHPGYATDTALTTHAATSHGVTDHGALSGLADDDHTQYAKKAGDTFTGAANFNGGMKIGSAGTLWLSEVVYQFSVDPGSVAANTTAVMSIPEGLSGGPATILTTDDIEYRRGLQGPLLWQGTVSAAGAINLRVRNVDSSAWDQGSTVFEFIVRKR